MRSYEASSFIEASPEQVWPVLTDIAAWPNWDSDIVQVTGRLAVGEKVAMTVKARPSHAMSLTVVELRAPERLVFRGGLPLGLFTNRLSYSLAPEGTGTRFASREEYTGLLAGMIFKKMPDLRPAFRRFAEGLKQRVEEQTRLADNGPDQADNRSETRE